MRPSLLATVAREAPHLGPSGDGARWVESEELTGPKQKLMILDGFSIVRFVMILTYFDHVCFVVVNLWKRTRMRSYYAT